MWTPRWRGCFRALEETGQAKTTVVVFTGDHGQSLGEHGETTHGYFAYNATLWVPLIVAAPASSRAAWSRTSATSISFPTVCDLLGAPPPAYLQGVSLLPAARGKALAGRPIYFESLSPYYRRGWAPLRGYIEKAEKFIESPLPEAYDLKADFDEVEEPGRTKSHPAAGHARPANQGRIGTGSRFPAPFGCRFAAEAPKPRLCRGLPAAGPEGHSGRRTT